MRKCSVTLDILIRVARVIRVIRDGLTFVGAAFTSLRLPLPVLVQVDPLLAIGLDLGPGLILPPIKVIKVIKVIRVIRRRNGLSGL